MAKLTAHNVIFRNYYRTTPKEGKKAYDKIDMEEARGQVTLSSTTVDFSKVPLLVNMDAEVEVYFGDFQGKSYMSVTDLKVVRAKVVNVPGSS
jgi:hypothetical protein